MASSISRRRFLRHVASASAVAAAGVTATAAANGASHPDADLIALGEEFDRLFPRERAAWKAANEACDAFDAAFPGRRFDPLGNFAEDYWNAFCASAAFRLEGEADALSDETLRVTDAIRQRPAATFAGMAVKARVLKRELCLDCVDPRPREDWNWNERCLAGFIEEAERLARTAGA